MKMEVADQHFKAGNWFENVIMRERHHVLLGGMAVVGTEIKICRHVLHGPRRRIIKREVIGIPTSLRNAAIPLFIRKAPWPWTFFVLALSNSYRKRSIALFPIVDVA